MKGILYLHIDSLEGKDVTRFEDTLIKWTITVKERFSKSVKLFDRNRVMVGETTQIDTSRNIYQVKFPRISIEYICIVGNMCILTKVIRRDEKSENIIYEIPNNWDETNIWYSY